MPKESTQHLVLKIRGSVTPAPAVPASPTSLTPVAAPASPTSPTSPLVTPASFVTCNQLPPWVSVGHYTIEPDAWTKALVTMEHKLWPNGSTITYSFLAGENEPQLKETVNSAIAEYQRYANLNFKQLADGNKSANIRIMLMSDNIVSAIGIDALRLHDGGATMKLGYRIGHRAEDIYPLALHGIGHALGLMHEDSVVPHSNFPNPDKESVMWTTAGTRLALNLQLSDSDKAWLVVNYPGRDATIDGTTWTLMYSLGVLQLPAHVIASILTSSDVSKKRDLYTGHIIKLYEHVHVRDQVDAIKVMSDVDSEDLSHEPPPLGDAGFTVVSEETPDAPPPPQPDDDEFSESVAAAVMHPQFRAALSNVVQQYINDNAPKLGIKLQPAAAQPSNAVQSAVPQHSILPGWGPRTGPFMFPPPFMFPVPFMSPIMDLMSKPSNIQSALAPNGIQSIGATGRVLSPAEQQVMNGFFTSIFGNPVFKSVLTGVVKTITNQDEQ